MNMATKKSAVTEVITIKPVERLTAEIKIVGDTPLIVHAWSEKAKKEILDNQQGKKKRRGLFSCHTAFCGSCASDSRTSFSSSGHHALWHD